MSLYPKELIPVNWKPGQVMSLISKHINKFHNKNDILIINTPTTGLFLDNITFTDNSSVTRVKCITDEQLKMNIKNKYDLLNFSKLEDHLSGLNKKYDLILIDSFHTFDISYDTFKITSRLLKDEGIILSHDCIPTNKNTAAKHYIRGNWCGQTYLAFIKYAMENKDMYFGVLDIDYGIGIASKKSYDELKNVFDEDKRRILFEKGDGEVFDYFIENKKDLIN